MGKFSTSHTTLVGVAASLAVAGCSFVSEAIKSETSAYAEPTGIPSAHIRLIGSRNVKVYPNSECASYLVPGSGYPAGPQMGGQRKRDLGMPKPTSTPNHYVEIAARAGEPITAAFAFHAESYLPGAAGTGMPATRNSASCTAAASFVPQVDRHYEMTATWLSGSRCAVQVFEISQDASGVYRRTPVLNRSAEGCPVPPTSKS